MRYGVTMFMTDQTMAPVELARAVEERGLYSLYVPEHTHIPTSRLTPPPTGDAELRDEYKRTLDPLVALAMAAAVTERLVVGTGICLVAQREPIVTAKAIATLDQLSGGRFVLGIGFGWNADEIADHGVTMPDRRDVAARARARDAGAVEQRRRLVRRQVRADPADVVVAEAGAARRPAGADRRRARARSCSRTSPSTPTAGSRSAARASAPRCPTCTARAKRPVVIRRRCRSCRSARFPTRASSSTTSRSVSPRSCCGCPSGGADRVLPILDEYAPLVGV